MVNVETTHVTKALMNTLLERKLEKYGQVLEVLDENVEIWKENRRFCKTVDQFKKVSQEPNLDIYLADHLLKYKLDFQMYQYRKMYKCFFQSYFCARIMAKKALAA